jgi:hypothetical protein
MQVERMIERSGTRSVEQILRDIDRKRGIDRMIRNLIFGGLPRVIAGVLLPRDIAPGTIFTPDELERVRAKQLKNIEVPDVRRRQPITRPEPGRTPLPRELEEIETTSRKRRLQSVQVPQIPRRSPIPVRQPPARTTQRRTRQSRTTRGPFRIRPELLISILTAGLGRSGFTDPLTPTRDRAGNIIEPGTPTQTQPTRTRTRTVDDLCRERATQQRKKRRKCKQRLNVVWAGGPNKGKIAGTKCATFEDTF